MRNLHKVETPSPLQWIVMGLVLVFLIGLLAYNPSTVSIIVFVIVGVPIIRKMASGLGAAVSNAREGSQRAAQISGADDPEKPKRRPEYAVGDDGELVELNPTTDEATAGNAR